VADGLVARADDQKATGVESPLLPSSLILPNEPIRGIEIQVIDAQTNRPVSGGVANIRFTLNGWAEKTDDKLISLDKVDLTNAGRFAIAIPDELRGRHSYLQVSIKLFKPSPDAPLPDATLNFHPVETVTLTARVDDEQGQPATRCDIAIFGTVRDSDRTEEQRGPFWRG